MVSTVLTYSGAIVDQVHNHLELQYAAVFYMFRPFVELAFGILPFQIEKKNLIRRKKNTCGSGFIS